MFANPQTFSRAFCALLVTVLLVSLFPQPAQASLGANDGTNIDGAATVGAAYLEVDSARTACRYVHPYARGEPLSVVARWYGISLPELRAANPWLAYQRLQEGDLLCIPRIRFDRLFPNAELQARVLLGRVTVWGTSFPVRDNRYWVRGTSYFVRVRADRRSAWKKVGTLRTDRDGEFFGHFRLPKTMDKAKQFEICLKEINQGWVICTRVDNRWQAQYPKGWRGAP